MSIEAGVAALLSVKLFSEAGKAAEAVIVPMGGWLLGIEPVSERDETIASRGAGPSSESGCAVPLLRVKPQGEAGNTARAAADLASGELRCQEPTSVKMIVSSSVEAPLANCMCTTLLAVANSDDVPSGSCRCTAPLAVANSDDVPSAS